MKKALTCIFMMIMIVFGSTLLVACDKEGKGEAVFDLYDAQISTMKEESSPFAVATKNNITSNYFLQNFNKKEGTEVVDYGQHDELIALALNYIEEYYPLTKEYSSKKNIQSIVDAVEDMKDSYSSLKSEYVNSKKVSSSEETTIYNGFMARYAEAARKFSLDVYDAALELSDYITEHIAPDATFGTDEQTDAAAEYYFDCRLLEIYNDYNDFIMSNSKGVTGSVDAKWFALQSAEVNDIVYGEAANALKEIFNALAAERANVQEAFDEFSYYDYSIKYNSDIKAYGKTLDNAELYFGQIDRYFLSEDNYLELTYNYIVDYVL